MFFSLILILIFITYCVLCKRTKKKGFKFSETLIPLILFSIICSIALGENFLIYNLTTESDPKIILNFLSYWIISKNKLSASLLNLYFNCSLAINMILIIIYSTLKILED